MINWGIRQKKNPQAKGWGFEKFVKKMYICKSDVILKIIQSSNNQ